LGQRLGRPHNAVWDFASSAEVFADLASVVPELAGITYERIEKMGIQHHAWDISHPGTP
jgi:predicted molibdopterin-dependent oxidoreductase YjgC